MYICYILFMRNQWLSCSTIQFNAAVHLCWDLGTCAQVPTMEDPKMPTWLPTPMATIPPRSPRLEPKCCSGVYEAWKFVKSCEDVDL